MRFKAEKIKKLDIVKHTTKKKALVRFMLVLIVFLGYLFFVIGKYGALNGFLVALLSWSFFVLCTPVADAGFLLDFPLRLITGVRMFFLEMLVWITAISLNLYALFLNNSLYAKTELLGFFKHILINPFPFWGIIILSALGTFTSVQFGDELLDKMEHYERTFHEKHKSKQHLVIIISLFLLTFILYDFLLKQLGVNADKLFD